MTTAIPPRSSRCYRPQLTVGSLFAGIGGFDAGFERVGMRTVWQVEIDQACRRVLERHFGASKFADVCQVGAHNLAPVDVICFGSPCQDLSVAGKREGLSGERSGLFHEAIRVLRELRPAIAVWENVPGAFSSDAGHDFLAVLRAFHECGARDIAWRVLDSRYFNVAQRRERVFVVADFRGERAGEILFESPCGCGDHPTREEARSRVAASLRSRSHGAGVSAPGRGGEDDQNLVYQETGHERWNESLPRCSAHDGKEAQTLVTHSLRCEGADASEDRTGRGTPLVAFNIIGCGQQGRNHAYQANQTGAIQHKGNSASGNEAGTLVIKTNQTGSNGSNITVDHHPTLGLDGSQAVFHPQIFQTRIGRNGRGQPKDIADNLTSSEGGSHADSKPHVFGAGYGVRRLMPVECLRLQGFPDDWLDLDPPLSDSAKYRMIGNAVTVTVAEWIGQRILEACA